MGDNKIIDYRNVINPKYNIEFPLIFYLLTCGFGKKKCVPLTKTGWHTTTRESHSRNKNYLTDATTNESFLDARHHQTLSFTATGIAITSYYLGANFCIEAKKYFKMVSKKAVRSDSGGGTTMLSARDGSHAT